LKYWESPTQQATEAAANRPLKIIAVNVNGNGRQAYKVRKQLLGLEIDVALFSQTHLKPHMRFCISNYDTYWTDREDGNKGGTAIAVKKDIPHTCADLLSFQ
jgi:hypothetical protein